MRPKKIEKPKVKGRECVAAGATETYLSLKMNHTFNSAHRSSRCKNTNMIRCKILIVLQTSRSKKTKLLWDGPSYGAY